MSDPHDAFFTAAGMVAVSVLAVATLYGAAVYASDPAHPERASASVQLAIKNEDSYRAFCSATHIGGGRFVTAWHCATATDEFSVRTDKYEAAPAEVLWSNKLYDLALVRAKGLDVDRAPISCQLVRAGTPVYADGNPIGLEWIRTAGNVVSKDMIEGAVNVGGDVIWQERIISDITIAPGNSGGGLFNEQGFLVGVNVGAYIGFRYAISVPSTTVCQLLGR